MAFRSLKPYLFDGFYRWCVDDGQTPHVEFTITADCGLPRHLKDNLGETLTLNVSPQASSGLKIDNDGLSFGARFQGVPAQVFIPLGALLNIYSKESTRTIPLNFSEVSLDPTTRVSSGVPSLSVPTSITPLAPVPGRTETTASVLPSTSTAGATGTPARKRHLSLVRSPSREAEGPAGPTAS